MSNKAARTDAFSARVVKRLGVAKHHGYKIEDAESMADSALRDCAIMLKAKQTDPDSPYLAYLDTWYFVDRCQTYRAWIVVADLLLLEKWKEPCITESPE